MLIIKPIIRTLSVFVSLGRHLLQRQHLTQTAIQKSLGAAIADTNKSQAPTVLGMRPYRREGGGHEKRGRGVRGKGGTVKREGCGEGGVMRRGRGKRKEGGAVRGKGGYSID